MTKYFTKLKWQTKYLDNRMEKETETNNGYRPDYDKLVKSLRYRKFLNVQKDECEKFLLNFNF